MQGIIFDLDETLIDRHLAVTRFAEGLWNSYVSDRPLDVFVEDVHRLDGHGYGARDAFFDAMMVSYPGSLPSVETMRERFYGEVWETPQLAEGVIEILRMLSERNIPLAIVSNGSSVAQRSKIQRSGIEDFFDAIVISEELGIRKPDARIYVEAADRLAAAPAECWFVGDHPVNDVWGSKQVGFRAAWVHLHRPWAAEVERCYDTKGATLRETMSRLEAVLRP